MTQPAENPQNPEVGNVEKEIQKTTQEIEEQAVKVENATTPATAEKEQGKLDDLIAKFDTLVGRLDKIDERLAEPTVQAPPAKVTTPAEAPKTVEPETPVAEGPPKKRRLGAWGG